MHRNRPISFLRKMVKTVCNSRKMVLGIAFALSIQRVLFCPPAWKCFRVLMRRWTRCLGTNPYMEVLMECVFLSQCSIAFYRTITYSLTSLEFLEIPPRFRRIPSRFRRTPLISVELPSTFHRILPKSIEIHRILWNSVDLRRTGSRILDPASGFLGLGSWIQVPGSWIQDAGSLIQDPGLWTQDPGSWVRVFVEILSKVQRKGPFRSIIYNKVWSHKKLLRKWAEGPRQIINY